MIMIYQRTRKKIIRMAYLSNSGGPPKSSHCQDTSILPLHPEFRMWAF